MSRFGARSEKPNYWQWAAMRPLYLRSWWHQRCAASDISLRLATGQPPQYFLPLMRRHLTRPSKPNTALLRSLAALARPSPDQLRHDRQATSPLKAVLCFGNHTCPFNM
jgi:hypothetical protein